MSDCCLLQKSLPLTNNSPKQTEDWCSCIQDTEFHEESEVILYDIEVVEQARLIGVDIRVVECGRSI